MPRTARLVASGATYHLTALGTGGEAVFLTERDGHHFMTLLERVIQRHRWNCLVYCLMPTHYHLVVETPESKADLARGMHRLNGCYAQSFNRRQGRFGHLFAERFYSGMVMNDSHMLGVVRYVARNPVGAGLCSSPGEWRWSSYAASIGRAGGAAALPRAGCAVPALRAEHGGRPSSPPDVCGGCVTRS